MCYFLHRCFQTLSFQFKPLLHHFGNVAFLFSAFFLPVLSTLLPNCWNTFPSGTLPTVLTSFEKKALTSGFEHCPLFPQLLSQQFSILWVLISLNVKWNIDLMKLLLKSQKLTCVWQFLFLIQAKFWFFFRLPAPVPLHINLVHSNNPEKVHVCLFF